MSRAAAGDRKSAEELEERPGKGVNVYRILRIARDMRVRDVAHKLDVTPSYIYAIEAGERTPPDKLINLYASALGVDRGTIIRFSGKNTPETYEKFLFAILKEIMGR